MYLDDLVQSAKRRWLLLMGGAVATALLLGAVLVLLPPKYELRSQVLLVPPPTDEYQNPFFSLRALESATDVVGRAVMSETVLDRVVSEGGIDEYSVQRDALISGPLLLVVATDSTREGAELTMTVLLEQIPEILSALQDREAVDKADRIVSSVLVQQTEPTVLRKDQIRGAIVAVGIGLGLTVGVAVLVDGLSMRRRRDSSLGGRLEPEESRF